MIGKLFRKSKDPTFKERVDAFWNWFSIEASNLTGEIAAKRSEKVIKPLSEQVDKLGPGFAWEAGPAPAGDSFTLSAEGDPHRQLLTLYWMSRAPQIKGWTFYPSRQPDANKGLDLVFEEKRFSQQEIWVAPTIDEEHEKFDLAVWHPQWQLMDDRQRWSMLFIFLDTQLGEYGTQQWIGKIEFSAEKLKDAISLPELPEFIRGVCTEKGWESCAPGEKGIVYQLEPHDRFPRGDITFGQTTHQRLLEDYLEAEGQLDDPLAGTGADYIYVTVSIEHLPKGKEVDARAKFEDAIESVLQAEGLGRRLGGATGSRFGYIDLLIFDAERSVAAIERILRAKNSPPGMHLSYFAKEKRKLGKQLT